MNGGLAEVCKAELKQSNSENVMHI